MSPALTLTTTIPPRRASGHQIVHPFQELPLFWLFANGTAWRGGLIDGQFEVSFDGTGDWWISDIWIACDNGRFGPEALGNLVNLEADDRFYLIVLDAIETKYQTFIDELIGDELAARGVKVAA